MHPDDDPGILGRLPRERPGARSGRRGEAKPSPAPESTPPHGDQLRDAPARGPARRTSAAEEPAEGSSPPHGDPLGDAARLAVGAAGAGLRMTRRLASGVLRRLPRP